MKSGAADRGWTAELDSTTRQQDWTAGAVGHTALADKLMKTPVTIRVGLLSAVLSAVLSSPTVWPGDRAGEAVVGQLTALMDRAEAA